MQLTIQYTQRHEFLSELINLYHTMGLPLHDNYCGSKVYSEFQKLSLVVLFRRSKKVLRDFVAELCETKWITWLQLREIPSKSVLNNWCKKFTIKFIRKLNKLLLRNKKPKLMAVDATGVDACVRSRHYEKRA